MYHTGGMGMGWCNCKNPPTCTTKIDKNSVECTCALYTCQLFLIQRRDIIILEVARVFKDDTTINIKLKGTVEKGRK